MFNGFLSSLPVIDVPVDEGNNGVVVTASVKALRIGARSNWVIVGLAGGCMVLLTRLVMDGLVCEVIGVGVDILAELRIVLEVFVAVSCVGDVRAGGWTRTSITIDVTVPTRVGMVVVLIADTIIGFVAAIGVDVLADVDTKTDLELLDTRASLEDSLRFC